MNLFLLRKFDGNLFDVLSFLETPQVTTTKDKDFSID